jgi:hypothetical protein
VLINEQGSCVADIWDGNNLKCTFSRIVSESLMRMWEDIMSIARNINFSDDCMSLSGSLILMGDTQLSPFTLLSVSEGLNRSIPP